MSCHNHQGDKYNSLVSHSQQKKEAKAVVLEEADQISPSG